jgi:hypothetical protein
VLVALFFPASAFLTVVRYSPFFPCIVSAALSQHRERICYVWPTRKSKLRHRLPSILLFSSLFFCAAPCPHPCTRKMASTHRYSQTCLFPSCSVCLSFSVSLLIFLLLPVDCGCAASQRPPHLSSHTQRTGATNAGVSSSCVLLFACSFVFSSQPPSSCDRDESFPRFLSRAARCGGGALRSRGLVVQAQ